MNKFLNMLVRALRKDMNVQTKRLSRFIKIQGILSEPGYITKQDLKQLDEEINGIIEDADKYNKTIARIESNYQRLRFGKSINKPNTQNNEKPKKRYQLPQGNNPKTAA